MQIPLELLETVKERKYKIIQWEDVELMFNTCSYLVKARRNRFRWTAYLTPIWLRWWLWWLKYETFHCILRMCSARQNFYFYFFIYWQLQPFSGPTSPTPFRNKFYVERTWPNDAVFMNLLKILPSIFWFEM